MSNARFSLASALLAMSLCTIGCADESGPPPPPLDQCLNAADEGVLMSDGGDAFSILDSCAYGACMPALISYTSDPDGAEMCMSDCFGASSAGALSDGCSQCYVDFSLCAASACLAPCGVMMDMVACQACTAMNCASAFEECSGLTAPAP